MLALLLISILTSCRSMTTGSLTCGGSIVDDPSLISCCNNVQFAFKGPNAQFCCNGVLQSEACVESAIIADPVSIPSIIQQPASINTDPVIPAIISQPAIPALISQPAIISQAAIDPNIASGPSLVIRSDPVTGTALGNDAVPNTIIDSVPSVNGVAALDANSVAIEAVGPYYIDNIDTNSETNIETDIEDDLSSSDSNSLTDSESLSDSNSLTDSDSLSESNSEDDDNDTDDDSSTNSSDSEESSSESSEETETDAESDIQDGSGFGAFLDGENGHNSGYNANASQNMDYYVKITLINMWLILGLILIVNVIFYWCYCRQNRQRMKMDRVQSNNGFLDESAIAPRSDADAEDDLI